MPHPRRRLLLLALVAVLLAAAYVAVVLGYTADRSPGPARTDPATPSPSVPTLVAPR